MTAPLTRPALVDQLQALGLPAGVPLMVHASLRRVGAIDGGADTLIDALLDVLGPRGTLVLPLGSQDEQAFDALTSPAETDLGVLNEVFRRRRETIVNDHPAGRFGAIGPQATELLEPIPLHDYYGPGSPLARFSERGWVLRLGADVDTVTVTHWAEYLARLPHKRRVRRHYRRADGTEQWVDSLDDAEGIAEWPHGDYFARIWLDYREREAVRRGTVGGAQAELFAAAPFVDFAVRWMEGHLGDAQPSDPHASDGAPRG